MQVGTTVNHMLPLNNSLYALSNTVTQSPMLLIFLSISKAICFYWPTAIPAKQLKIRALVITLKDLLKFGE